MNQITVEHTIKMDDVINMIYDIVSGSDALIVIDDVVVIQSDKNGIVVMMTWQIFQNNFSYIVE